MANAPWTETMKENFFAQIINTKVHLPSTKGKKSLLKTIADNLHKSAEFKNKQLNPKALEAFLNRHIESFFKDFHLTQKIKVENDDGEVEEEDEGSDEEEDLQEIVIEDEMSYSNELLLAIINEQIEEKRNKAKKSKNQLIDEEVPSHTHLYDPRNRPRALSTSASSLSSCTAGSATKSVFEELFPLTTLPATTTTTSSSSALEGIREIIYLLHPEIQPTEENVLRKKRKQELEDAEHETRMMENETKMMELRAQRLKAQADIQYYEDLHSK